MPITAQLHDGTRLEFPDGTDPAVIDRTVQSVLSGRTQDKPLSVKAGEALGDIPRQLGLTARYGLEGLGQVADVFTEPVRYLMNKAGATSADRSTSQLATQAANALGLPMPQTADERVIGDASRAVAGIGGLAGGAGRLASQASPGMVKNALQMIGAAPATQAAGAAGSGLAGGSVREAGGDDLRQLGASVLGGVGAGMAANVGANAARAVGRVAQAKLMPETVMQQVDQQINLTLRQQGVDWAQVPERARQQMRADAAAAIQSGQPLNADALRRLVAFRMTGTTPTVGALTQDPGLITREMNLAKTAANTSDPSLQRLPQLQNQNVGALLQRLDESGARGAPTPFEAGQRVIDSLKMRQDAAKGNIDTAYKAARATAGRAADLNGAEFTRRANQLLDEAMLGGTVPPGVQATMNRIAMGEMPFTVDIAEQFKTQLGKIARKTNDGQQKMAMEVVRQALDEAPIVGMQRVNPGNLPAVRGSVPPSAGNAAEESLNAFAAARRENAQWMRRVEGNPALQAVVDGVEPDRFMNDFVLGNGATVRDLQALKTEIGPEATNAIRQTIVKSLKDAATNSTDDINKFSNQAYRNALKKLGPEKLAVFFDPEEIRLLRAVGDAGKYMQAQPAGTAVNNSNSGAMLYAKALDMLDAIGSKLPFGTADTISGVAKQLQQRHVMNPTNALALPRQSQGPAPNLLMTGVLASPVQAREDERRNKRP